MPPRSAATAGSTVATASVSKATKETVSRRPMVSPTRLGPNGFSSASTGVSLGSAIVRPMACQPLPAGRGQRGNPRRTIPRGRHRSGPAPGARLPARRSPSPIPNPNQRWLDARSWLASFAIEQSPECLRHPGGGAHHLLAVVGVPGDPRHAADPRHRHSPRCGLPRRHHLPAHRAQLGACPDLASAVDLIAGHLPARDPARPRAARADPLLAAPTPPPPGRNGRPHRGRTGESLDATGASSVWGVDRVGAGNWTTELRRARGPNRRVADTATPDQPLLPQLSAA